MEDEYGIECAVLSTTDFSSDEHQKKSKTKVEAGENPGELQNRKKIVMKAQNVKQNDMGALHGHHVCCSINLTLKCLICAQLISA